MYYNTFNYTKSIKCFLLLSISQKEMLLLELDIQFVSGVDYS